MSIRIGNMVYMDGLPPVALTAPSAEIYDRLESTWEVTKETLEDLQDIRPGGIVRVGRMLR